MKSAAPLIRGVSFDALLSDKAFVADWLLHDLDQSDILSANPLNANNKIMQIISLAVVKLEIYEFVVMAVSSLI